MSGHEIHEHHEHAADHHEHAAKHHREAAKHHKAGNHEKAAHHSKSRMAMLCTRWNITSMRQRSRRKNTTDRTLLAAQARYKARPQRDRHPTCAAIAGSIVANDPFQPAELSALLQICYKSVGSQQR